LEKKNYILNLGNKSSFRIDNFYRDLWKKISKNKIIHIEKNPNCNNDYIREKFNMSINRLINKAKINLSKTKKKLIHKVGKLISS
jgi:hypothetical protein